MLELIIQCIYLMIPAYAANMAPVLVKKVNFLNKPVDFGRKFNGEPIFGSHKTWRGLFFGIIAGIVFAYLQSVLQHHQYFSGISFLDYSNWLLIGFLLGFGALLGDLIKSFFKRRVDIKPGQRFIPWDQIDYSIGSLLLLSFVYVPSISAIVTIIILNFILHVLFNHLSFYLKLSKVKW